jgi:uncharacterized membrane protein YuzA (DUF378 family)
MALGCPSLKENVMKQFDIIAAVLVVVGALNWGLIAVARFDLVAALFGMRFGEVSALSAAVYGLVGVAGPVSGVVLEARAGPLDASRHSCTHGKHQSSHTSRSTPNHVEENVRLRDCCCGRLDGCRVCTTAVRAETRDVVDTAIAAGSFKTLAKALDAAGLVTTLKGAGPFTVFAPTDEAFAKLPDGTLETLLKPENKEKLRRILTYHVVPGKVMASDVVKLHSAKPSAATPSRSRSRTVWCTSTTRP